MEWASEYDGTNKLYWMSRKPVWQAAICWEDFDDVPAVTYSVGCWFRCLRELVLESNMDGSCPMGFLANLHQLTLLNLSVMVPMGAGVQFVSGMVQLRTLAWALASRRELRCCRWSCRCHRGCST